MSFRYHCISLPESVLLTPEVFANKFNLASIRSFNPDSMSTNQFSSINGVSANNYKQKSAESSSMGKQSTNGSDFTAEKIGVNFISSGVLINNIDKSGNFSSYDLSTKPQFLPTAPDLNQCDNHFTSNKNRSELTDAEDDATTRQKNIRCAAFHPYYKDLEAIATNDTIYFINTSTGEIAWPSVKFPCGEVTFQTALLANVISSDASKVFSVLSVVENEAKKKESTIEASDENEDIDFAKSDEILINRIRIKKMQWQTGIKLSPYVDEEYELIKNSLDSLPQFKEKKNIYQKEKQEKLFEAISTLNETTKTKICYNDTIQIKKNDHTQIKGKGAKDNNQKDNDNKTSNSINVNDSSSELSLERSFDIRLRNPLPETDKNYSLSFSNLKKEISGIVSRLNKNSSNARIMASELRKEIEDMCLLFTVEINESEEPYSRKKSISQQSVWLKKTLFRLHVLSNRLEFIHIPEEIVDFSVPGAIYGDSLKAICDIPESYFVVISKKNLYTASFVPAIVDILNKTQNVKNEVENGTFGINCVGSTFIGNEAEKKSMLQAIISTSVSEVKSIAEKKSKNIINTEEETRRQLSDAITLTAKQNNEIINCYLPLFTLLSSGGNIDIKNINSFSEDVFNTLQKEKNSSNKLKAMFLDTTFLGKKTCVRLSKINLQFETKDVCENMYVSFIPNMPKSIILATTNGEFRIITLDTTNPTFSTKTWEEKVQVSIDLFKNAVIQFYEEKIKSTTILFDSLSIGLNSNIFNDDMTYLISKKLRGDSSLIDRKEDEKQKEKEIAEYKEAILEILEKKSVDLMLKKAECAFNNISHIEFVIKTPTPFSISANTSGITFSNDGMYFAVPSHIPLIEPKYSIYSDKLGIENDLLQNRLSTIAPIENKGSIFIYGIRSRLPLVQCNFETSNNDKNKNANINDFSLKNFLHIVNIFNFTSLHNIVNENKQENEEYKENNYEQEKESNVNDIIDIEDISSDNLSDLSNDENKEKNNEITKISIQNRTPLISFKSWLRDIAQSNDYRTGLTVSCNSEATKIVPITISNTKISIPLKNYKMSSYQLNNILREPEILYESASFITGNKENSDNDSMDFINSIRPHQQKASSSLENDIKDIITQSALAKYVFEIFMLARQVNNESNINNESNELNINMSDILYNNLNFIGRMSLSLGLNNTQEISVSTTPFLTENKPKTYTVNLQNYEIKDSVEADYAKWLYNLRSNIYDSFLTEGINYTTVQNIDPNSSNGNLSFDIENEDKSLKESSILLKQQNSFITNELSDISGLSEQEETNIVKINNPLYDEYTNNKNIFLGLKRESFIITKNDEFTTVLNLDTFNIIQLGAIRVLSLSIYEKSTKNINKIRSSLVIIKPSILTKIQLENQSILNFIKDPKNLVKKIQDTENSQQNINISKNYSIDPEQIIKNFCNFSDENIISQYSSILNNKDFIKMFFNANNVKSKIQSYNELTEDNTIKKGILEMQKAFLQEENITILSDPEKTINESGSLGEIASSICSSMYHMLSSIYLNSVYETIQLSEVILLMIKNAIYSNKSQIEIDNNDKEFIHNTEISLEALSDIVNNIIGVSLNTPDYHWSKYFRVPKKLKTAYIEAIKKQVNTSLDYHEIAITMSNIIDFSPKQTMEFSPCDRFLVTASPNSTVNYSLHTISSSSIDDDSDKCMAFYFNIDKLNQYEKKIINENDIKKHKIIRLKSQPIVLKNTNSGISGLPRNIPITICKFIPETAALTISISDLIFTYISEVN